MNDEMRELQRQLEAATAPDNVPEGNVDAETSSLRRGWLGLGQLLDAAEATLAEPSGRWQVPVRRKARRGHLAMVAVLAASLLVAVTIAWLVRRPGTAGTPIPASGALAAGSKTPGPKSTDRPKSPSTQQAPRAGAELEWDDSLDEQLASAAEAVMSVQQTWHPSAGSVDTIWYGLQQVEDDFDSGSLF